MNKENKLSIDDKFANIKEYINVLENCERTPQQLLSLKEDMINFSTQLCATYIKEAENSSELIVKLEKQKNSNASASYQNLASRIIALIKD